MVDYSRDDAAARAGVTLDQLTQISEGYSVPHVVGTCAMGSSPDAGAVVDAAGRVHGTHGLLVADASIIPTAPSGFRHLPTIMIAERVSEPIVAMSR